MRFPHGAALSAAAALIVIAGMAWRSLRWVVAGAYTWAFGQWLILRGWA